MAIRKGNFDREFEIKNDALVCENQEKKVRVLKLIEKCKIFVEDIKDIIDTFYYVKSQDKKFAQRLWSEILCHKDIDVNSYWGFSFKADYYNSAVFRTNGIVLFYDPNDENHYRLDENDKAWTGKDLKNFVESTPIKTAALEKFIRSLEGFYIHFPTYRDRFFNAVDSYKI